MKLKRSHKGLHYTHVFTARVDVTRVYGACRRIGPVSMDLYPNHGGADESSMAVFGSISGEGWQMSGLRDEHRSREALSRTHRATSITGRGAFCSASAGSIRLANVVASSRPPLLHIRTIGLTSCPNAALRAS